MNLHLPIIKELEDEGHNVIFFSDEHPDFDYKERWRGLKDRVYRHAKAYLNRSYQKYWKKRFSSDRRFAKPFDLLFIINGCCFHPYLLKRLRRISPKIKSVLYLWDNSAFYDYFHYAHYFDKVFTYDMNDAEKYKAGFLPFYYTKDMQHESKNPHYLVSIVGSNHSGRLEICRKVYHNLMSRIATSHEAYSKKPHPINGNGGGNALYFKIIDPSLPEDNIVSHTKLPIPEVIKLIKDSYCILDTDRESQTGTTPRLIWALAMNKKVITTNKNIVNFWFYNPEQILVIDRNNPIIPDDFIFSSLTNDFAVNNISRLRIDNWIKKLITV